MENSMHVLKSLQNGIVSMVQVCGGQYKSRWLNKYPSKSMHFQVKIASFQVNLNWSIVRDKWMCPSSEWENEVNERYLKKNTHSVRISLLARIFLQTYGSIFQALTTLLSLSLSLLLSLSPHTLYAGTSESSNFPPSLYPLKFQLL